MISGVLSGYSDRANVGTLSATSGDTREAGATTPILHLFCSSKRPTCIRRSSLFDHLVGAGEQRRRHSDRKGRGSNHVDGEVKLRRLLDWQVSGLGTAQDLVDIFGGTPVRIREIWAIRQ